jgi:hypothetical protein
VTEIDVVVEKVRVHLGQRKGGTWNELDSVEWVGPDVEW